MEINGILIFDAILAIYHDQGLIPFKTLTFGEGTNFTAGLSRVRTSPDHGTAFEIAGKGVAKLNSFRSAMFTARKIYQNRKNYSQPNQSKSKVQKKTYDPYLSFFIINLRSKCRNDEENFSILDTFCRVKGGLHHFEFNYQQ